MHHKTVANMKPKPKQSSRLTAQSGLSSCCESFSFNLRTHAAAVWMKCLGMAWSLWQRLVDKAGIDAARQHVDCNKRATRTLRAVFAPAVSPGRTKMFPLYGKHAFTYMGQVGGLLACP
jgi:hypothetical protein